MRAMRARTPLLVAAAATVVAWSSLIAQTAGTAASSPDASGVNACALLTAAEVEQLINRGRPSSGPVDTTMLAGGGSVCHYPVGAQVILFSGQGSQGELEALLKPSQRDKETRHPVAGVGDQAYIMFPAPRSEHEGRVAFLVTTVGRHTLGVSLPARKGTAGSIMAELCRSGQNELSKKEREQCTEILANKGETAESLQPAVVELAKLMAARLPGS